MVSGQMLIASTSRPYFGNTFVTCWRNAEQKCLLKKVRAEYQCKCYLRVVMIRYSKKFRQHNFEGDHSSNFIYLSKNYKINCRTTNYQIIIYTSPTVSG